MQFTFIITKMYHPESKTSTNSWNSSEQSFEVGQFELWYQPTYFTSNYEVLHNEVLLRWRDFQGKLYLPDEFMPILADMGLLPQLDRYVVGKAIEALLPFPRLHLSINLSDLVFDDQTFLQDLKLWITNSKLQPRQLSFELAESVIAQNFSTALAFVQGLTALGCLFVIDSFTGQELTLAQCKQLPVDLVKLHPQFLEEIRATSKRVALVRRLQEISHTLGQVTVKSVADQQTLKRVLEIDLDGIQGNLLRLPEPTPQLAPWINIFATQLEEDDVATRAAQPDRLPLNSPLPLPNLASEALPAEVLSAVEPAEPSLTLSSEPPPASTLVPVHPEGLPVVLTVSGTSQSQISKPEPSRSEIKPFNPRPVLPEKKPSVVWRFFVGTAFVGASLAAVGIAATSILHRMTNMTVNQGVVNGRLVRLRSPINGNITEFYARPGAVVDANQVLARIERIPGDRELYEQSKPVTLMEFKSEPPKVEPIKTDNTQYTRLEDLSYKAQQEILQLRGDLETKQGQLEAAERSKRSIASRLQEIQQEYQQRRTVEISVNATDVPQKQALLDQATAHAKFARSEYERFQALQIEGVAPAQRVDQLRAAWEAAQAEVTVAKEALRASEVSFNATEAGLTANNKYSNALTQEASQLDQQLEQQSATANTLVTEVSNLEHQLVLAENLYNVRRTQMQAEKVNQESLRQEQVRVQQAQEKLHKEQLQLQQQAVSGQQQLQQQNQPPIEMQLTAPFSSIVYRTEREKGEIVNQSEAVLSLLDCNNLWVETVVSAEDASRIDLQQPVQVRLGSHSQILKGEVDLIQPMTKLSPEALPGTLGDIDNQGRRMQVQALSPTIPAELMDEPFLKRVTVKIPPPPDHGQAQQLCGLGQVAHITFAKRSSSQLDSMARMVHRLPDRVRTWLPGRSAQPVVVSKPGQK
ncbi:MAG: EAL domain-containing protein [Microcoleaceae cyanobacterium]